MHILKVLGGVALLRGGGLNVLAHPTTNEVQRREPTSLGMLGDYTIVLGTWVGPITPGGPNVNITGQLQDVHKKILEMNPLYDPKDFGHLNDGHGNITNVAKRNAIVPPNCNVPYPAARTDFIDTCILWAEGTPGAMCIPPGPRVCLVMTGNDDAIGCNTIYVCNDNSYEICPQSAYLAGNYAQRIVDGCTYSSNGVSYVRGQEFDTDGYNVIVSGDCSSGPASKRDEPASHEVQRREPDTLGMIGDYKIISPTWVGPIVPGGPNVTLTGRSFHHIHEQILELNPAHRTDFEHLDNKQANSTAMTERNAILPPDCNVPYWVARADSINGAIQTAEAIAFGICIGPGPRVCGIVVMASESDLPGCDTIYVCNDNAYEICPNSAYLAGNYAQRIVDSCAYTSGGVSWVHGQVFDTDGYNVIVSGSCDTSNP